MATLARFIAEKYKDSIQSGIGKSMTKPSVLILGAGLMQRPAILSAKELGFRAVVVDANPNAESVSLADEFKEIDLKAKDEILNFAEELTENSNLKGIFTAGTDFSASVSYAGEKLGFSCHSYEAALNATIKPRMRKCFERCDVPSPKYFSLSGAEITEKNVLSAVEKLSFPCVVKPADNMGARGCRMIRSMDEAWRSVKIAAGNSRTSTVILEEYMEGPEFSIDAIVYNGTLTITGFADRHIFYKPYFIETGHTMPSKIDEKMRLELISAFADGVKALGLTCGAAKADIKYTEKGPQIGEIAARLSGGYMSGWTYPYSSGINLTAQALLVAAGKEPSGILGGRIPLKTGNKNFEIFDCPSKNVSAERAWISIPGKVKSLHLPEKESPVQNVFPRPVKEGGDVDFPRNNVQKCGNVITKSDSYEKAVSAAEKAVSAAFLRLEPNVSATDFFLSGKFLPDEKGFPPSAFSSFEKIEGLDISGKIPAGFSVLKDAENFPELKKLLELPEKDWNFLNALQTAERFDSICPGHPALDRLVFWKSLFRGGLQGAIYISDSCSDSENKV